MKFLISAAAALAMMCSPVGAQTRDKIIFSLNWVPYGLHYGVFAAEAQGFYRDANLDVDIQRGYGSGDTVKRVATGAADFGMADTASLIIGRGKGLEVKQVAVILDRAADVIFYVKGVGIEKPSDLEGHSLGAATGETPLNLLPVFAAGAKFDPKKIRIVNLTPPAKFPTLVSKGVDSIVALATEAPAVQSAADKAGVKLGRFDYSDFGVDYYSIGLIASDETLAKRGDLAKRFIDATMKGHAWAIRNPDAAADAFVKRFPESSRDLTLAQWKVAIGHIVTERTRKNGLGYMDPEKMAATLELIKKYQDAKAELSPDEIFSAKYLSRIEVTE
ncbi:ABC transporter substrate-binding protein [Bradyrhizobium sp. dw_411]|uniref:ABC transporter substrate-binding protein n=1 Tax=Bradyrhizobium sp. dw_411 TaxID=2720082 RepID=UPI001BCFF1D4|nr:ABC transporter substrate-binding protein [Bradyrhizobium sp. dw_411]